MCSLAPTSECRSGWYRLASRRYALRTCPSLAPRGMPRIEYGLISVSVIGSHRFRRSHELSVVGHVHDTTTPRNVTGPRMNQLRTQGIGPNHSWTGSGQVSRLGGTVLLHPRADARHQAYIHVGLGGLLFTLNAIGYLGLAIANGATAAVPTLWRYGWLPRIGLAGYALVTIGAYLSSVRTSTWAGSQRRSRSRSSASSWWTCSAGMATCVACGEPPWRLCQSASGAERCRCTGGLTAPSGDVLFPLVN